MSLSRDDVEKVALLGRLRLSGDELERMTAQLTAIIDYVQQLADLNTDDVEPMAHAVELNGVFRADQLQESLPREEALANAPHHDGVCYLVPAVLGE